MSKLDVIRVWKDEEYRSSLSGSELRELPANPAGMIDLSDIELGAVAGGTDGTAPTGCIPICTAHGCASFGGLNDWGVSLCLVLSALALCMYYAEGA